MKKVKLIKLKDNFFNGNHPNRIFEGHIEEGYEITPPTIGERYIVRKSKMDHFPFSTSIVKSLPDENGIFKTTYSTYQLKYLKQ